MNYINEIVGASFVEAKSIMARLGFVFNPIKNQYENGVSKLTLLTYACSPPKDVIDAVVLGENRAQKIFFKRKNENLYHYFWEQNAMERTSKQREETKQKIARQ